MNIQAGMTVKLKNQRGIGWNDIGQMDIYQGATVYIEYVGQSYFTIRKIPEDDTPYIWNFNFDDIEEILEWEQPETHYLIHN